MVTRITETLWRDGQGDRLFVFVMTSVALRLPLSLLQRRHCLTMAPSHSLHGSAPACPSRPPGGILLASASRWKSSSRRDPPGGSFLRRMGLLFSPPSSPTIVSRGIHLEARRYRGVATTPRRSRPDLTRKKKSPPYVETMLVQDRREKKNAKLSAELASPVADVKLPLHAPIASPTWPRGDNVTGDEHMWRSKLTPSAFAALRLQRSDGPFALSANGVAIQSTCHRLTCDGCDQLLFAPRDAMVTGATPGWPCYYRPAAAHAVFLSQDAEQEVSHHPQEPSSQFADHPSELTTHRRTERGDDDAGGTDSGSVPASVRRNLDFIAADSPPRFATLPLNMKSVGRLKQEWSPGNLSAMERREAELAARKKKRKKKTVRLGSVVVTRAEEARRIHHSPVQRRMDNRAAVLTRVLCSHCGGFVATAYPYLDDSKRSLLRYSVNASSVRAQ